MADILEEIFAQKRREVARARQARPLAEVRRAARAATPPRDFLAALIDGRTRGAPALIAEIKRASPSRGAMRPDLDPAALAAAYAAGGAAALSVLTDGPYFRGSLDDLVAARRAADLPALRKDFIFAPYQVYEARAAGADAVLLIVAMLDDAALAQLHRLARDLGMTSLVEVHDARELERALALDPPLVGINNRDLTTFDVDLRTTEALVSRVPPHVAVVAESGLRTRDDVARVNAAGVDAMLVGGALVSAGDPEAKVRELLAAERLPAARGVRVKVCGITRVEDARDAVRAGVDLLGFNFYPPSPRSISVADCRRIRERVRAWAPDVRAVGVFVNAERGAVISTVNECGLDLVQLHGDETPAYCADLRAALGDRVFRALRPVDLAGPRAVLDVCPPRAEPPAVLVDARQRGRYGGTGKRADWSVARALARDWPLLLAGGLTAENVAQAVRRVEPWGVDVASGVESAPGRKSTRKMTAFVRAVRRAEAGSERGLEPPLECT